MVMANNYSQDFGVQSASYDSSQEALFGTHATFQRVNITGTATTANKTEFAQIPQLESINKKSDWTMEMPKIEY